jgi:hypothetical protein
MMQIDPQFTGYLRDPPGLSYTNPEYSWFTQRLVSSLEALLGRNKIEAAYCSLKRR